MMQLLKINPEKVMILQKRRKTTRRRIRKIKARTALLRSQAKQLKLDAPFYQRQARFLCQPVA
jgi:hypothetical protein